LISDSYCLFITVIISAVSMLKQGESNMKMLKEMLGSRKAFSAVIASLILMLLAVAAGVVVYAYVMGWVGGATTNPRQTGHLSFDTISASVGTSKINLALRNVGGTNLMLANVYVQSVDLTSYCSINFAPNNYTTPLNSTGYLLPVQSVANIAINYTLTTGVYYNVQVACKDGTTISQSVQAQ
jgi:hypothetical protein